MGSEPEILKKYIMTFWKIVKKSMNFFGLAGSSITSDDLYTFVTSNYASLIIVY